jgi:AP-3 complex subunit beta
MWMDRVLPDWLEKGVESTLRDSEDDAPPAPLAPTAISSAGQMRSMGMPSPPVVLTPTVSRPSSRNGAKGPWQDLDSFYAEEEEEEDDDDDSDDGEEGSSEEEEEEEDEGTGSDDDVTVNTYLATQVRRLSR